MRSTQWRNRFFATTRGQVVGLLRRGPRTISDLAASLGLTGNALRGHIAALERDGLVERQGTQRGAGKPAALYGLSHAAEDLFPQAYAHLLGHLLDAMGGKLRPSVRDEILEEAGRRSAALRAPAGDARARLEAAVAAFAELGGLAEVEQEDGRLVVRGYGCPLSQVTSGHPEACRLAAAMLSEMTGLPIVERCTHGAQPSCRFEVAGSQRAPVSGEGLQLKHQPRQGSTPGRRDRGRRQP